MTVENAREKTITDHLASYSPKKKKNHKKISHTHTQIMKQQLSKSHLNIFMLRF